MEGLDRDIPKELAAHIEGKTWPSVHMLDWRMVGATPAVFREYLIPATFAYYLPSLLTGSILDPAFRDWAFEAILPANRQRKPKGDWWFGTLSEVLFVNQLRVASTWQLLHEILVALGAHPSAMLEARSRERRSQGDSRLF